MGVRWGVMATDLARIDRAAAEGFDFAQASADLVLRPEEETGRWGAAQAGGLPLMICAVPLPPGVRVTERGFNLYVWTEHLKRVLLWMASLGCRAITWSDGRARLLPVEGEVADLKEQTLQFLFVLGDAAEVHGMTVLVEPLGPSRTNFLNSLEEIAEFLPKVGKDNFAAALSLRELEAIGLPFERLGFRHDLVRHVVLENPQPAAGGRRCPRPDDGYDYAPFVRALRGIDYDGTISLPADADEAGLEYCRRLWTT